MTLDEWNKRPDLQAALGEFLKSPVGRAAVSVLRSSCPRLDRGTIVDAVTASIELGRINQHFVPIELLERMDREIKLAKQLGRPDWGVQLPPEDSSDES
jgi:hypothetical protein